MKKIITLILLIPFAAHAQFPYLKGKEASGVLLRVSNNNDGGSLLSYEVSDSRIGFTIVDQKLHGVDLTQYDPIPKKYQRYLTGDAGYDDKRITTFNVGFSLNESTFSLARPNTSSADPGIDVNWFTSWVNEAKRDAGEGGLAKSFFLGAHFETKGAKLIRTNTSNEAVIKQRINTEAGFRLGYNFIYDDANDGTKWFISISSLTGYSHGDTEGLDEQELCTVSTINSTQVLNDCKEGLVGELNNKIIYARPMLDVGYQLYTLPQSGLTNKNEFDDPKLFLIGRLSFQSNDQSDPIGNAFLGLSLTRFSNQVIGAILIESNDFTRVNPKIKEFNDSLSVVLYAGIPLSLK